MKLEAMFDAVIVKPLEDKETMYGNIVVPDLGKDKNEQGEVIAVGPGKPTITGEFISTQVQVGDVVILPTMGFTKLEYDGEEYFIGPENQILAKIKNEK
jgi:chaperonin GroES